MVGVPRILQQALGESKVVLGGLLVLHEREEWVVSHWVLQRILREAFGGLPVLQNTLLPE